MKSVSVIIPTYNRSQYILECIESVFNQSYLEIEVIVVDDNSTDDTEEKLSHLVDQNKIKYFHNPQKGASSARNLGIKNSTGDLIAFLDSDDVFYPDKLERQVRYCNENPEAKIVHADFDKFNDSGNLLGRRYTGFFLGNIYPQILEYWEMLIAISCVVVKPEVFGKVGLFDESLSYGEDLDMWARVARRFAFHHIPESLSKVRLHEGNLSREKSNLAERFLPYLNKAINVDNELTRTRVRKIYSNMYCYLGLNILADGSQKEMRPVRSLLKTSINYWPWQYKPWGGLMISSLGKKTRNLLGSNWRKWRDKKLATTNPTNV